MADKAARKRAIDEYKQRKRHAGVFAVRCAATGHTWVGASPNLEAAKNGLWFTLRLGSRRDVELQAEWKAHGEDAFTFEVLEELDEDVPDDFVRGELVSLQKDWAVREQAGTLLP